MASRHIVAVHANTSQLDEPVYRQFATLHPENAATLIYWNDFGLQRTRADPELGVLPIFPNTSGDDVNYKRVWLDCRKHDVWALARYVANLQPHTLILNDVTLKAKVVLAGAARLSGVHTGFRSDKNAISTRGRIDRAGLRETMFYRCFFNCLFNVSQLTTKYYRWTGEAVMFPYSTDAEKFSGATSVSVRANTRRKLDIPDSATVLLSVIKFISREGASEATDICLEVTASDEHVITILVGSGSMWEDMRDRVRTRGLERQFRFIGYVPYGELQDYFFASDLFVHFARCEPWGVSVLDALCAGLGVVASDQVGAAVELLHSTRDAKFLIPFDRPDLAVARAKELIGAGAIFEQFADVRARVLGEYSVAATAARLNAMVGSR